MPITDYKITDIERDAVSVEKQRPDVMDPDADITKAWFDTYPDKIRTEHNSLIDYLGTMPIAYTSSAAAATANKGSITGYVPLGGIIELSMTNGNTAVSPTIAIDGVTHTITSMPTTAQVQANSTQTYRLVKSGATALTFTKLPDYICEYGKDANNWVYERYASGKASFRNRKNIGSVAVNVQDTLITGSIYLYRTETLTFGTSFPYALQTLISSTTTHESSNGQSWAFVYSNTAGLSAPMDIRLAMIAANANLVSSNVILNNVTYGTWY